MRGDRGTGMISSAAGVVVFLMFLLFAVQLLFGLYATSTVTAVAHDAALRAASADAPPLERIEADARRSLGEVGSTAGFTWRLDDTDDDGAGDTVVLEIVAVPPRFLPASISTVIGQDEIRRVVRVRVEQVAS